MSQSEVAQLRAQIELECQALQLAMAGFAVMANHEAIAKRYNAIDGYQKQLEPFVGEKEAIRITVEAYIEVIG